MPEPKSTVAQRKLRDRINAKYGGRCSNPDCRWLNEDGSKGCTDVRALHIDHVLSGGSKELRRGWGGGMAYYYRVLSDTSGKYQLLCANCNAIKRCEKKEAQGRNQHERF